MYLTNYRCKLSKRLTKAGIEPRLPYIVGTASDHLTILLCISDHVAEKFSLLTHSETATRPPTFNEFLEVSIIAVHCAMLLFNLFTVDEFLVSC